MRMDRGKDARVGASASFLSDRCRRFHRFGWQCLLVLLSLVWGVGLVHAASYYYDSNGRLTVVTRADGTSARYVYDDLGNIQQVAAIPAGQLSLFGFTPNHGPVGTAVTLFGQGFNTTAANDTVTFNGVAAAVVSATATTLVATVPAGATTGAVMVTVGTGTATSSEPFVVDANGAPPTIASVTPAVVAQGATVTIAGQHLAPVSGQTRVTLNGQAVATTSVTDTAVSFAAPKTVASGRITVQTPFGLATSASDLIVTPSGISPTTIATSGRIAVGGTQALAVPASKNGVLLFDAADTLDHDWLSLQLNALSGPSSLSYQIYDPQNNSVINGSFSSGSPTLHLPKLTRAGTYSLYFIGSSTASTVTVGLESAPQLVLNASNATPVVTAFANQSKRYIFLASPGVMLGFPSVTTNPTGQNIGLVIRDIYGVPYTSSPVSGSSPFTLNLPFLTTGATYQAVVTPVTGATENATLAYQQQPGAALTINDSTVSTTASPGINAFYTFTAAAGDNLELAFSGLTVSPTGLYTTVYVYDPSGNRAAYQSCSANNPAGACHLTLSNLVAGTYSVTVACQTATSTMSYQTTLTRDVTGTLTKGISQTFNLTTPGQSLRLTFAGTAGDTVAVGLSQLTTTPTGKSVAVTVMRPDGTTWINGTEFSTDGAVNLPNLPTTGNYTVFVSPDYGLPASFQLVLAPNPGGTLVADGPSQSATTFAGQNAYFSFAAAAGDNLELGLSSLSIPSTASCSVVNVNIYDPNNNSIATGSWYPSNPGSSWSDRLWGLASGTYTVVLSGCPFTGTATLTRDIVGSLSTGQTLSFNTTRPGQTVRLGFAGTAGQTLSVSLSNLVTTPANKYVTFKILKPDGTSYVSSDVTASSIINLPNLPVTGNYTIIVSPDYGIPASFQVSLLPQVGGVLTIDGSSQSAAINTVGQNAYFTFTASTGDNLELGLSGLTTSGSSTCVSANVYNAANSNMGGASWYVSNPASSAHIPLPNLTAGTYTVVLAACGGVSSFSGTVTLTRDLTNTLSVGSSQSINLSRPGQSERLSFAGTMGQTLAVVLNNPVTTPTGTPITLKVLKPDGTLYASTDVSSANGINLPNLPVSGVYTVVVSPDYGLPATAQVSLQAQVGGPLTADGSSEAVSTATGQSAYFNFTAAAGDNLELGLSGLTVTGTATCVNAYVLNSAGGSVGNTSWYTSNAGGSAHITLWNLAAGTYTGTIGDCTTNETFSGTLTLTHDLTSALTAGTPATVNLSRAGQAARITFNATAGQTLTATLSNVVTTPAGQSVSYWVLNPSGSQWTSGTVSNNKITLSNLPTTGAYTLILAGYYGEPVSMTILLQ